MFECWWDLPSHIKNDCDHIVVWSFASSCDSPSVLFTALLFDECPMRSRSSGQNLRTIARAPSIHEAFFKSVNYD